MNATPQPANDQAQLWNGPTGRTWVEMQETLDRVLKPFENLLVGAVSSAPGRRVLDVGCGTGSTTVTVARALGAQGRCTGIDISETMIGAARSRAARDGSPASFICANAQSYPFEPASFDLLISRFGVMFFNNPVEAFANLCRAAAPHAELHFIAWRSPAENPFLTTAERAAAPLLPNLLAPEPDAPGGFAFANSERVRAILNDSGWTKIHIRPVDVPCTLLEKELLPYVTRLGPVGRALVDTSDHIRAQVIQTIRPAFDPFVHAAEVRFTAACWIVSAHASTAPSPGSATSNRSTNRSGPTTV